MSQAPALDAMRLAPAAMPRRREPGLRGVLGEPAWQRLPAAVRARFGEPPRAAEYAGAFDIVEASLAGRALALLCRLLGTPVVPRTGLHVPAIVHVGPAGSGVRWTRQYRWPDARTSLVCSTKVIAADGTLLEKLPARLCMELAVREDRGALHFVSRRYYFDLPLPWKVRPNATPGLRLVLPWWLSPGTVHVVHEDEAGGWFRFTMIVTHPVLGRLFHQTGRFHALGD
jgi:hypothetical protein